MDFNKRIDDMKDELIKSTQEILKIKSVAEEPAGEGKPFGEGIALCLETALKISEKLGFKTGNIDGYAGYAELGEGDEYVAVLGHLDVVPEVDGWMYPPYGAEIHNGKIYARGALDDKGPIMAALYALKAIKDSNVKLSKKVRIIFGTNEENGSTEIEYYLSKEKPPIAGFTPDADFPIIYAEKGITMFKVVKDLNIKQKNNTKIKYIKGGHRPNMVPDYCEARIVCDNTSALESSAKEFSKEKGYEFKTEIKDDMLIIKCYGVSAHGSTPELGKNAVMQLLSFLGTLNLGKCDVADFINFFNKYVGMEIHGESFGVCLEDEPSGKLSFNVGAIDMTEDKASITLNLRYPVTYKYEDMMEPFNKRIEEIGLKIEDMVHQKPLYYPEDHPLIQTLQRVYAEQTGQRATLLAIGGGTYAKEMPNIVAFGPIFPGKPNLDHQVNEYIEIDDLILNAKIYAHAIYELAK
ncbi:MAG: dipeptidase PepV [Caloramator sp.]|nr:dipeptidase PepV [Caloramator sp.]